jgi:transposase
MPQKGKLDFMMADSMKTENMSQFLRQVSKAHPKNFIIMVVDGASSHKSNSLIIPDNISLILLPPYSPELNPAERIWNCLRRDYFANKYFETLDEAIEKANFGLAEMKQNWRALKSLTLWPWITMFLKAT